MAELKTTRNDGDVDAFLDSVENETRHRDAKAINKTMQRLTGMEPEMWGNSIVGFGAYTYKPKSGGSLNEWMKIGFSPRKQSLTLYIMDGFSSYDDLLGKLGSHSTGKSCLYIRDLEKVDQEVLEELITESIAAVDERIAQSD
jgi:hypothetical protein